MDGCGMKWRQISKYCWDWESWCLIPRHSGAQAKLDDRIKINAIKRERVNSSDWGVFVMGNSGPALEF